MKKLFVLLTSVAVLTSLLIVSCSKDSLVNGDAQEEISGKIISEFDYSETHFIVSTGAPFGTKANNAEEYLTISANQDSNSFALVSSKTVDDNNMVIFKHYDLQGEPIAIFYVIDGTLVDMDIALDESKDYVFTPITKGRRGGEGYFACVKRTYQWAVDTIDDSGWKIICDAPVIGDACYASEAAFSVLSCIGKE